MNKHFLIILFFLLNSYFSWCQPIIELNGSECHFFGTSTSVFEDKTRQYKLNDIVTKSSRFLPVKQKVYFPNFTSSALWIKFQIKNLTSETYFLEIDNPVIDSISLFVLEDGKLIQEKQAGDLFPFHKRDILRSNYIFKLDLPKDKLRTIYIRYITSSDTELPLTLGTTESLMAKTTWMDLVYGFIYGILVISVLYNAFLFFTIKDRSYLFYILYLISFILLKAQVEGHLMEFVIPDNPTLNNSISFFTFALTGIFITAFALEFLKIKHSFPRLFYTGRIFLIGFASIILTYFFNKVVSITLSSILMIFLSPYLFLLGIYSYKNGYKPARYYLIATAGLLLSILFVGSRSFGIIAYSFFYNNAVSFAITLEAVLLSLALGERYESLKQAKDDAQSKLNNELEIKIEERTRAQNELKKLNNDLIQSNTDLDNFIYTASHDLKTPVMNIEGLISILKEQNTKEENVHILNMIDSSVSKFNSIVNDLTEVAKVQRIRDVNSEINKLSEVVNESIKNLIHIVEPSNPIINYNFTQSPQLLFSRANLLLILENLISNAIKFSSPDRQLVLFIKAYKQKGFTILEFTDNGIGISETNTEKVFLMFKRAHSHNKGRGIGLYIVKRIMENSGGRIELESKEGIGSTFRLMFPDKEYSKV